MKNLTTAHKPFSPNRGIVLFGIAVSVLALGMSRLDHVKDPRQQYASFLWQKAQEFRKGHSADISATDSPEMALLQDYIATVDPALGYIPSERLNEARQYIQQTQNDLKVPGASLTWMNVASNMGGRTRAIVWDPNVAGKVWAGSVTGGLWYNNNIYSPTSPWMPVSETWDDLSVNSIAIDPSNSQIMYVGTGEAATAFVTYRESGTRGMGILKSADGGQTWTQLASTSGFAYISKLVVRKEGNIGVIYAGVASGIYHGNQISQPSDGLFRSTDGGNSWTQVLPNIPGLGVPYTPNDIELGADGKLYVGTMPNIDRNGGCVVLCSASGLAGSWTAFDEVPGLLQIYGIYPLAGRVEIATAPSDANVVYAAFAAGVLEANTQPVYKGFLMYKSTDKGLTWNEIGTPGGTEDWATLAWHAMTLAVDPNNANTVWAGGLDLWRATDGGNVWTKYSDWALMYYGGGTDYVHADQHAIVYKPGSSSDILFGCDGGVFMTQNANATTPVFQEKSNNYNTLQFYICAQHPSAGINKFLGGLQDNGTELYSGSALTIQSMVSGGDGAYCFWDENNPLVYITSYYYNRYYLFNNGNVQNYLTLQSGVFINPADYESISNRLFANGVDFWGNNAKQILRAENIPNTSSSYLVAVQNIVGNEYFSAVKASPYMGSGNSLIFLGTTAGRLYRVKDANTMPVATDITGPDFPVGNISSIAIGGSNDTLMVTFSNYGVNSVWQTYNGGVDWTSVEGNLPDMPIRWAIYHAKNTAQAMVATELGVWTTTNLRSPIVNWTLQHGGFPKVRVDMLTMRKSDNQVLVASHGRGMFYATYPLDYNTGMGENAVDKFQVSTYNNALHCKAPGLEGADYQIVNTQGKVIGQGRILSAESIIPMKSASHGTYILVLHAKGQTFSRKFVW